MTWRAIAVFDIDGVIRDVGGSYRRALADTVEQFTQGAYRPTPQDIDTLKAEGCWNNDWEGSQELIYRHFEAQGKVRGSGTGPLGPLQVLLDYDQVVDYFQRRYRGPVLEDPSQWTGYISQEPVLVDKGYFDDLSAAHIAWAFFSGATRGSARYVLERRIGLNAPPLVAMEDAPGKPDPIGLFQVVDQLDLPAPWPPVIYAGDTVADMQTLVKARHQRPETCWIGVGILPPHVNASDPAYIADYRQRLFQAGADIVLTSLQELTPDQILGLATS
ncbi:TIGR01548 family HAD-type hydrolase [Leptolyngbya sp. PCC 6406]|uniref:TIGR01548 family HAD-type hydrolase n=1 Tax=Leptolyngbya sp. PCC 6406 TaxID=1173264 RepID=UPI0002AC0A7F|nr:TIGR01548 family HAD-type hydrolase [Leptolyngbya sp. PCC 6406]